MFYSFGNYAAKILIRYLKAKEYLATLLLMPEIWRKKETNFNIIVWQSIEPVTMLLEAARLSEPDYLAFLSFKSETRKREWTTVRAALRHLDPLSDNTINYNENGRPQLVGEKAISISHSGDIITVMTCDNARIGIDIEKIHPRIEKLAPKFVNEKEFGFIDSLDRQKKLHIIWGAKEVLFKIYSKGNVDFRKELQVEPFENSTKGICKASIKKTDFEKNLIVYYEQIGSYMLTYSIEEGSTK
jgi:4'-phosphopantetheinyl transferase